MPGEHRIRSGSTITGMKKIAFRARERLSFLKGSVALVLMWPILGLLLSVLLWFLVLSKIADDREAVETAAIRDAAVLAGAYADHLTRTVEQIDQITLLIKYEWEKSHRALRLEDLLTQGVFPATQFTFVTIIDRNGVPVTGTLPLKKPTSVVDRDYFRFHLQSKSNALVISKPTTGRVSNRTVIQFTRRLNDADGAFDGVVLISTSPAYFASFHDGTNIGKNDVLATIGKDGVLRMSSVGRGIDGAAGEVMRTAPPATLLAPGSLRTQEWFADRADRFVAWQPLSAYPLVALVGLSAEERLAPHRAAWAAYRNMAIAGSLGMLLFAIVATLLSTRLAWRKRQKEEVQDAYRIATEGGNDGFYMLRAIHDKGDRSDEVIDFEVVDCNERGASFYGMTRVQFIGQRSSKLNSPAHFPIVLRTYCNAMETGLYEDELKVPSESPVKVEWIYRRLVRYGSGLAITIRDITEAKAHERELWNMANQDALTGLPNRNWMMGFLPAKLDEARRSGGMLALLFIDLDDFKNVNDAHGHSIGDELLQAAAQRIKSLLRPDDHVVRLGGDEFTVILEHIVGPAEPAQVAARITEAFARPFDLSRGPNSVGASIGISVFPRDGGDIETLLKNSDIAMYHAKGEGKGHFHFYAPSLSIQLKARLDTERALQTAIEQRQFVLHYQPRIGTLNGDLRGMEALVRWMHPERGLVPPLEFIRLAEQTGQILKLGEIVLEQACTQIVQWKAMNLPLVPISINVSPYQFNHGNIRDMFSSYLGRYGIDPSLVEIEITESSMMDEHPEVARELAAIRTLGIKLLVDDFGTGYSSLSQLQRLDMDVLKVDRSFTSELGKTTEGEVFFRAIVSMAHALGMSVVAEGVETGEQLQVLQALCCDEIQGYFISRPVPADEAKAFLRKRYLTPLHAVTSMR
jgi:diguanylate cyclase (GGDEF)-like protein